jgi:hypothetical protein
MVPGNCAIAIPENEHRMRAANNKRMQEKSVTLPRMCDPKLLVAQKNSTLGHHNPQSAPIVASL